MSVDVGRIERKGWLLTALLLLASLAFRSPAVSVGVLLGALLAVVNFRLLRSFVFTLASAAAGGGTGPGRLKPFLLFLYLFKFLATGLVIFLAFKYNLANPFALLAGVSVISLAICWEAIAVNQKMREGTNHAS